MLERESGAKLGIKFTPKSNLTSGIFKCTNFTSVNFTLPAEKYDMLELILLLFPVCQLGGILD